MSNDFRIQIGGKTYTPDNIHEITSEADVSPDTTSVTNVSHGEVTGVQIQAGDIQGGITLGRD